MSPVGCSKTAFGPIHPFFSSRGTINNDSGQVAYKKLLWNEFFQNVDMRFFIHSDEQG